MQEIITSYICKNDALVAYKAFKKDLTCKKFQYEIGKSYREDNISVYIRGFHCCKDIFDISANQDYTFYKNSTDRLCKVKVWGKVQIYGTKICASDIEILEDITDEIPKIIEYAISLLNKLPADIYTYFNIPIEVTRKLKDRLDWEFMSMYQVLSEDYIREFSNKVIWRSISHYQKLSESFIREFRDKVHWENICVHQPLSESFIEEFQDKVDWKSISAYQKLSCNFIRKFQDRIDLEAISRHKIDNIKNFIEEFQDKVNWVNISFCQSLSEDLIRKFKDKVHWREISHIKLCHI